MEAFVRSVVTTRFGSDFLLEGLASVNANEIMCLY